MNELFTLGLDVSTSVVGYAVLGSNAELHETGYVSISKIKGLSYKAEALKKELEKYVGIIGEVAIEEPLIKYKDGFSRAQVISLLSQFNGMAQFICYDLYKVNPVMYNVNSIRSIAFPGLKFPGGCNRKELVRQQVALEYPEIDWLYRPKATNLDGSYKYKDEMYDISDAIAVAKCHIKMVDKEQ